MWCFGQHAFPSFWTSIPCLIVLLRLIVATAAIYRASWHLHWCPISLVLCQLPNISLELHLWTVHLIINSFRATATSLCGNPYSDGLEITNFEFFHWFLFWSPSQQFSPLMIRILCRIFFGRTVRSCQDMELCNVTLGTEGESSETTGLSFTHLCQG